MHRSFLKPWVWLGGWLAIFFGQLLSPIQAQLCTPESRPLIVTIKSLTRLQHSSRKPIKTVLNPKEGLLTMRPIEQDPSSVLLVGEKSGITRIELEDVDGTREVREVHVQADTEYLTSQLRKALPISSIQAIPSGESAVILTGFVGRAEDIQLAQQIASNSGFQVINGLKLNGVQQVQLDVVIAQVRREKDRIFGFNFLFNSPNTAFGSVPGNITSIGNVGGGLGGGGGGGGGGAGGIGGIGGGGGGGGAGGGGGGAGGGGSLLPTAVLNPLSAPAGGATIMGGILGNSAGFLGFLRALEREGVAKVLAQPRLVALSGQTANFNDGGQQAIPQAAGLGVAGVTFVPFGTSLQFLPIVLGNGRIHLEVEPSVTRLDAANGVVFQGSLVPGRAEQTVHTTVEMEAGQTFVIGGLIQKTMDARADKIPVLGELPFVGAFFSAKEVREVETELVILVTPHLVDAQSSCQVGKVLPGEETRSPDDFELYLESILEAPRGPREVFQGNRYVPAFKNGPTADMYPCAGNSGGGVNAGAGMRAGPACSPGNGSNLSAEHLPPFQPGAVGAPAASPTPVPTPAPVSTPGNLPPGVPQTLPPIPMSPAEAIPTTPPVPSSGALPPIQPMSGRVSSGDAGRSLPIPPPPSTKLLSVTGVDSASESETRENRQPAGIPAEAVPVKGLPPR